MVELETKITESGVLYVPKEIRQCFGRRMKIIPNATAAVFYPADANLEDVKDSLQIILADIEHRIRLKRRRES
mgnify:FL=1